MEGIYDYISLDNPTAALGVVNEIYNKIQVLTDFPEMGSVYRKEMTGSYEFFSMDIIALFILLKPIVRMFRYSVYFTGQWILRDILFLNNARLWK